MLIAKLSQPLQKLFQGDFLAHTNTDAQAVKILPADALLYRRSCLGQYNDWFLAHQPHQYIHAAGDPFHAAGLRLHGHHIHFRKF